jgi:multidrug resistance efflux pump
MEMLSACVGVVNSVNVQPKTLIAKGELLITINPQEN